MTEQTKDDWRRDMLNDLRTFTLGDMKVVGMPPAKLAKALAVIADTLHPSFNANPKIKPDHSKRSCVLCSLTVREFLTKIGFADAAVASVATFLFADRGETRLHSAGIGSPEDHRKIDGNWCGHMVVTVAGYLIDTTLYQAMRPQWPDLTGQIAVPLYAPEEPEVKMFDLALLAALSITEDDYEFNIGWCDRRINNGWRHGPDARDRLRRIPSVQAMVARFGEWKAA
jgi:hypothetical protein